MLARLLALVCLSIIGPSIGRSGPVGPAERRVFVYLGGADAVSANETEVLRRELDRLMTSAGYQVELRPQARQSEEVEAEHLVLLKLDGVCDGRRDLAASSPGSSLSLAESAVVDGHVLPFATIHCGVLSRMLSSSGRLALPSELYWRSMGRIVAHELYHILVDEVGHDDNGAAKACFRLSDLLDDHFAFQAQALRKLRPEAAYSARRGGAAAIRQTLN